MGKPIARHRAMRTALTSIQSRWTLRLAACFTLLVGIVSIQLEAGASLASTASDFQNTVHSNFKCLKPDTGFKFEIGVTQYVPLSLIKASQPSFTAIKAIDELQKATERYGVIATADGYALRDGRSVYPPDKKAIGIVFNGRVYLLDGHHKALISLYFNAHSLPIEIIEDWTFDSSGKQRTEAEFREKMIRPENAYAYPNDADGNATSQFYDLCELKDDPNLYLARLLIQKVKAAVSLESLHVREVSGSDHPLILKLNEGIPFLEFYIAAALKKNGIDYKASWGDRIPIRVRKDIRSVIVEEAGLPGSPLKNIILLENYLDLPTKDRSIDRKRMKIIYKHLLNRIECDELLGSPTASN